MSKLPLFGGMFEEDFHVGFHKMDPHFMWLGLVSSTAELIQHQPGMTDDEQIGLMTGLLYSTMSMMEQKSYIQGLVDFFKAVEDPKRYAEVWTRNLVTSATPASSLVRNWYQSADPVMRDVVNMSEALQARTIFGVGHDADDLPPVYTPIGTNLLRVIEGTSSSANWFNMMSPISFSWESPDVVYQGLANMRQHMRPPRTHLRQVDLRKHEDDSYQWSSWHAWQEATGTVKGLQDLDPHPDQQELYELNCYEYLWHYYSPEGMLHSKYQEHLRLDEQAIDPEGRSEVDKWVRDAVQDYRDAGLQVVLNQTPSLRIALNESEIGYLQGLVPEYKRKFGVDSPESGNLLQLIKQLEIGAHDARSEQRTQLQPVAP